MYEQFYALDYDPFRLTPSGRDVFSHPSFERARAYLEYGLLRGEGFVVVTGPPGSGKTTLSRELLSRLPEGARVAEIETSRLAADDLLRLVVSRFSITPPSRDKAAVLEALRNDLRAQARKGGRSLLVVDEAHDLPPESLEELRLLTNLVENDQPLLQILLLGQPPLRDLIRRPELEQFHQRTVASCRLSPLEEDQAVEFVRFRLARANWRGDPEISVAALQLLHSAAEGIPRRMNLLCSRLFLHGFAEARHRFGVKEAIDVLEEMEDESVGDWQERVDEMLRAEEEASADECYLEAPPPEEPEPVRVDPPITEDWEEDPLAEVNARATAAVGGGYDSRWYEQDDDWGIHRDYNTRPVASASRSARGGGESTDIFPLRDADRDNPDESITIGAPPSRPSGPSRRVEAERGRRRLPMAVAVVVALFAMALVVIATTPLGDSLEDDVQNWLNNVSTLPSSWAAPATPGGDTSQSAPSAQ